MCVHRQSGQQYAVKIVTRRLDCSREISLLRACQGHPNIVNLHEVYYDEVSTIKLHAFNYLIISTKLGQLLKEGHVPTNISFLTIYFAKDSFECW